MRHDLRLLVLASAVALGLPPAFAAPMLQVNPSTFDFGWAPDNSKITAEFSVVNSGDEMVPLTALKPSCGCTATDFQPDALASREERKISLTFNTRGYANQPFNKPSELKTDLVENKYVVYVKGHVLKADNGLLPDSEGVAAFQKDGEKRKKIGVTNKTAADVTIAVVQAPAPWVKIKLPQKPLKPGEVGEIEISVDGDLGQERDTSFTIAPGGDLSNNRATIAVRTGNGPPPYRAYTPPSKPASPKPAGAGKPAASPTPAKK